MNNVMIANKRLNVLRHIIKEVSVRNQYIQTFKDFNIDNKKTEIIASKNW